MRHGAPPHMVVTRQSQYYEEAAVVSNPFDSFNVRVTAQLTRRRTVGLLGLVGAASLGLAEASEAKKKRKKKKKSKKNKRCQAQPVSTTCAGKCGTAINNCQQTVTCDACPDGQCCSGAGTCGACIVFASSTTHEGNLGGLSGADAICQGLADAAGLSGTYMAWLSDDTDSPSTRFVHATVAYTLVNGAVVASSWSDLTDGGIAHAIDRTESAAAVDPTNVWTNTLADGTAGGFAADGHCENWLFASGGHQGNTGFTSMVDAKWTKFSNHTCGGEAPRRLYCFQQR